MIILIRVISKGNFIIRNFGVRKHFFKDAKKKSISQSLACSKCSLRGNIPIKEEVAEEQLEAGNSIKILQS